MSRRGGIEINGNLYKDVGISGDTWNEHIQYALSSGVTDLLTIYCYHAQAKTNRPQSEKMFEIIPPEEWKMSRFETNPEVLKANCLQMGNYVKSLFGDETPIKLEAEKYANINYHAGINP